MFVYMHVPPNYQIIHIISNIIAIKLPVSGLLTMVLDQIGLLFAQDMIFLFSFHDFCSNWVAPC